MKKSILFTEIESNFSEKFNFNGVEGEAVMQFKVNSFELFSDVKDKFPIPFTEIDGDVRLRVTSDDVFCKRKPIVLFEYVFNSSSV